MNVEHYPVDGNDTADSLIRKWEKSGYGARRLAEAATILEKMISDKDCTVFFGFAGALVPAGLRGVISQIINSGWVDCVVTTSANITHDLVESFGGHHTIGSHKADDRDLHQKSINRIYDVFMPNKVYELLEDKLSELLPQLPEKEYSIQEFLFEFGKLIPDESSFVRTCADKNIPLFCPALGDSGFGMQLEIWSEQNSLKINILSDLQKIRNLAWDSKKVGMFLVGGGVPKNHIIQAVQFSPKESSYAVQITTDRPEAGGLSGATLSEAISWGKVGEDAEFVDVLCDATIALPILASSLKARLK